jgi:hypothetical protein
MSLRDTERRSPQASDRPLSQRPSSCVACDKIPVVRLVIDVSERCRSFFYLMYFNVGMVVTAQRRASVWQKYLSVRSPCRGRQRS